MWFLSRQVYNILHSTNPTKETDAVIVNLKTENKQLKEVIATLYLKYKTENEDLQRKVFVILIFLVVVICFRGRLSFTRE